MTLLLLHTMRVPLKDSKNLHVKMLTWGNKLRDWRCFAFLFNAALLDVILSASSGVS